MTVSLPAIARRADGLIEIDFRNFDGTTIVGAFTCADDFAPALMCDPANEPRKFELLLHLQGALAEQSLSVAEAADSAVAKSRLAAVNITPSKRETE